MTTPGSWRGVVNRFKQAPKEVQKYFEYLLPLAGQFPGQVILPYLFSRIEYGHNMTIYCGVVKLHRADADLTWNVIDKQHMTRDQFRKLFTTVFGGSIPKAIYEQLEVAERVRDKVIHGHYVADKEIRKAVVSVLGYAEHFNNLVRKLAGFPAFGKYSGFKGRGKSLDRTTTRWLLKGMDFSVK